MNDYPLHLEREMELVYERALKKIFDKVLKSFKKLYKKELQTDANVFSSLENELFVFLDEFFTSGKLESQLFDVSELLDAWARAKTKNSLIALAKQLPEGFMDISTVRFNPDDPQVLNFIKDYTKKNMELVKSLGHEYVPEIGRLARQTFSEGRAITSYIDKDGIRQRGLTEILQSYTEGEFNKARFWARDQVGDAYSSFTKMRQTQAGIDKYIWRTVGDSHVRGLKKTDDTSHIALEGKMFDWKTGASKTGQLSKPGAKHPGRDYNCVIGESNITFNSNVKRCFRRRYSGKLSFFITSTGKRVGITPNHPILTLRGWIRAKDLKLSDYIVEINKKGVDVSKLNINNRETQAEEIFNSALLAFPLHRVGGLVSQFHGDGIIENEVDIISIDGDLSIKDKFMFLKNVRKFIFAIANKTIGRIFVSRNSLSLFGYKFSRLSSFRFIRFFCQFLEFVGRHFRKSENVSLSPVSSLDSVLDKNSFDDVSGDVIFNRTSEFRKALSVICDNGIFIHDLSIVGMRSIFHNEYSGYVYNFETENNIYFINGVSSHNCRCSAEPYIDGISKAGPEDTVQFLTPADLEKSIPKKENVLKG